MGHRTGSLKFRGWSDYLTYLAFWELNYVLVSGDSLERHPDLSSVFSTD